MGKNNNGDHVHIIRSVFIAVKIKSFEPLS